jgi:hypothetical protein
MLLLHPVWKFLENRKHKLRKKKIKLGWHWNYRSRRVKTVLFVLLLFSDLADALCDL